MRPRDIALRALFCKSADDDARMGNGFTRTSSTDGTASRVQGHLTERWQNRFKRLLKNKNENETESNKA